MTEIDNDGELGLNFISPETRSSALIVQRVSDDRQDAFIQWQRGITGSAKAFPGYERTDVFPPVPGERAEWYVMVHFRGHDALEQWLNSAARADWLRQRPAELGEFTLHEIRGFEGWFPAGRGNPEGPPGWKMALTVLLGLYPTVMILSLVLSRPLASLPYSLGLLVSNVVSVCLLQWIVMPLLTKAFSAWLRPRHSTGVAGTIGGAMTIVVLLACMAGAFVALS